ncbi:uncharacterized protein [Rutidosis leptorrhynchoides]|uniref:uncharacterized protein n=1 Tax=Rutidosis leptorrhynchoides TaxID=125765 RepID=UPI003A993CF4
MENGVWHWDWTRILGSRNECALQQLVSVVKNTVLIDRQDTWYWEHTSGGIYRVRSARNIIDRFRIHLVPKTINWLTFIPRKVNVFIWRFVLNCLPTRWNLLAEGVVLDSIICPVCRVGIETASHLFLVAKTFKKCGQ